jgi:23S rRNA (cytosine1962-C5)-methyltransferase
LWDPYSPIRVRVLHRGKPQVIDASWWRQQLSLALDRRNGLFDSDTNGYRCINGESDGWPGLVLDRYDKTLVLKLYTAAWLPHLKQITSIICQQLHPQHLILRRSRNIQNLSPLNPEPCYLHGTPSASPVTFLETALRFEADVLRGQKTGFFLDQRENRRKVETLSRGRGVLNLFSFSGAFSAYAARGGARSVTDVDISPHALESTRRNFALNQNIRAVAACRHELAQADAFKWLEENASRKFDLVIADPPAFAKSQSERTAAIRAYGRLATLSLKHLGGGGILVACSCSAHVTADEFFAIVLKSAAHSGRKFNILETTGHAPDHPARIKEQLYLKAIYLTVN